MSLKSNASSSIVNLFDDDDSIPGPSFLKYPTAADRGIQPPSALPASSNTAVAASGIKRPAVEPASAKQPAVKTPNKPSEGFALLWVAHHGRGHWTSSWREKHLHVIGIYSSEESAEEAKERLMEQHDQAGHGDILVGDMWDDEIDLVILNAPLFFEE